MKTLILLFILTINNYASETIVIPKDVCIYQLEKVVKNGWSDSNETLNTFIIKGGKQAIPWILKQLHKPLSFTKSRESIDDIPNLLVSKNDYFQLFTYVKYLEHKGEEKKAYTIYIDALKGLKNTKSRSMIAMIFRLLNEKIILTSLRESLTHNRFSEQIKSNLKKELKELLLLDNRLLLETIEYEYMIVNKIFENSLLKDISNPKEKELMSQVLSYSKSYINAYHQKLEKAIISNTFNQFENSHKKEIEQFQSLETKVRLGWSYLKVKLAILVSLEPNYKELAKGMAKTNYLVATPSMNRTYKDYIQQVENNQKFLENLE